MKTKLCVQLPTSLNSRNLWCSSYVSLICVVFTYRHPFQSQTQSGTRYTPHLTRFYSSLSPSLLISLIKEYLESQRVQCRSLPPPTSERGTDVYKLRVGGQDLRRERFKGWVEVEKFTWNGGDGSFCLMRKDEVHSFLFIEDSILIIIVVGQPAVLETALEGPRNFRPCRASRSTQVKNAKKMLPHFAPKCSARNECTTILLI